MNKLFSFLLLIFSVVCPACANVGYVRSNNNCGGSSPLAVTLTITSGDTAIVVTSVTPTTVAVSTITGGGTYVQKGSQITGANKVEIWATAAGAATTASSVSVSFTGSPTDLEIAVADYSGVLALGNVNNGTNSNANPTVGVTAQDNNNIVVAGFASPSPAYTTGTGNLRQNPSSCSTVVVGLNDNTTVSLGLTITNTVTHGAANWAAVALELRSLSGHGTQVGAILVGP